MVASCVLDELGNSLEGNLHPVFRPHPLLSRTFEESESIRNSNYASSYTQDSPLSENIGNDVLDSSDLILLSEDVDIKSDKISDDIVELHGEMVKNFGTLDKDMVGKQEDYLLDKNSQQTEDSRIEDDLHWDKKSGKSEDSSDVESYKESYSENLNEQNCNEDGTNMDSYGHQICRVPQVDVSTNGDCAGSEMISRGTSEAFMTANVCELLATMESDKKEGMKETFPSIQRPQEDSEKREISIGLVDNTDSPFVGVYGTLRDNDDALGEQFVNGEPSCLNFESDQENKKDTATGEYGGMEQFEVTGFTVVGDKGDKGVTEDVSNALDMEKKYADKIAEHEENSEDTHGQVKENPQEVYEIMSIHSSQKRATTCDNITLVRKAGNYSRKEEDITNEVRFTEVNITDDYSRNKTTKTPGEHIGQNLKLDGGFVSKTNVSNDSEFCVLENIKEETKVFSSKQDVVKSAIASHGAEKRSDDYVDCVHESVKDSLDDNIPCSHKGETTVGLEELTGGENIVSKDQSPVTLKYENSPSANVQNNTGIIGNEMANRESDNESEDEINNYKTEDPQQGTSKMDETVIRASVHDNKSERETRTENAADVKAVSSRLGERASSLLSALKEEITSETSKDIQSMESSHSSSPHTSGGDVVNTQPDPTAGHSTSESQ